MKNTIQTKRNSKASTGFRKLHAKTTAKRRKLRVATAMADPHVDLESDVPNVGIGRALIIILLLHVVAIAAVYMHSTFFGSDSEGAGAEVSVATAAAVAVVDPASPFIAPAPEARVDPASGRYFVVTGDTYSRISNAQNVDETALRALNANRALRAGVLLDLPAQLSSRPVAVHETPAQRTSRAVAVAEEAVAPVQAEPAHARAIVIDEEPSNFRAVEVPSTQPNVATPLVDSGQKYTVKSGDTVWRIASRYKVSRDNLLKINGISDPRKLIAGREIVIPAQ